MTCPKFDILQGDDDVETLWKEAMPFKLM
jgi:hypothetical protein